MAPIINSTAKNNKEQQIPETELMEYNHMVELTFTQLKHISKYTKTNVFYFRILLFIANSWVHIRNETTKKKIEDTKSRGWEKKQRSECSVALDPSREGEKTEYIHF